jgi:hypothetical protein
MCHVASSKPSPLSSPPPPPFPHPSPLPILAVTHTHRHTLKTITMKHRKHLAVLRQSCTALHLHTLLGPKSKYCRHLLAIGSTSSNTAPPWQRKRSCTGKLLPSSVCQFAQNLDMSELTQGVHASVLRVGRTAVHRSVGPVHMTLLPLTTIPELDAEPSLVCSCHAVHVCHTQCACIQRECNQPYVYVYDQRATMQPSCTALSCRATCCLLFYPRWFPQHVVD